MTTITVTFVLKDGSERILDAVEASGSLMEAGRAAGVEGILADCGGGCDCGTCHVFVDPEWLDEVGPCNEIENDTLDLMVGNRDASRSRLSCQIALADRLDGLRVTVATS